MVFVPIPDSISTYFRRQVEMARLGESTVQTLAAAAGSRILRLAESQTPPFGRARNRGTVA
jgi:hypothetical protein